MLHKCYCMGNCDNLPMVLFVIDLLICHRRWQTVSKRNSLISGHFHRDGYLSCFWYMQLWLAAIRVCDGWYVYYSDLIMSAIVSQITDVSIVYSTVCLGADQRKQQSSKSLVFVKIIHRSPVNSPHKRPVTRKMFPFDDVMLQPASYSWCQYKAFVTHQMAHQANIPEG